MKPRYVLLLSILIAVMSARVWASGDSEIIKLTPGYTPRMTMQEYLRGRLGVLDESFFRRHLFFAYRQLEGQPFKDHEIAAYTQPLPKSTPPANAEEVSVWLRIAGLPDTYGFDGNVDRSVQTRDAIGYFLNCRPDAFRMAVRTYEDRAARFGKLSPAVQSWLEAQKVVFRNCKEGEHRPKPAEPFLPDLLRKDRAYQIATANFYAGNFSLAAEQFDAIARDRLSPWREWALYLAARAYVRIATLDNEPSGKRGHAAFSVAEGRLADLLANTHLSQWHSSTRGLRDYLALRKDLTAARRNLESRLITGKSDRPLQQDLLDFLWSLDQLEYPVVRGLRMEERVARDGGLTDWILTTQAAWNADGKSAAVARAQALRHALDIWNRDQRQSWAVAAILLAADSQALPAALHDQALKWGREHPAYATYRMQRLRWMESKAAKLDGNAQRALRDQIVVLARGLLYTANYPADGRNALREMILRHTSRIDEVEGILLAEHLPPIRMLSFEHPGQYGDIDDEVSMVLPGSAATWINTQLSLADMEALLDRRKLQPGLQANLAVAAWTRAVALGDHDAARRLSAHLASALPGLRVPLEHFRRAGMDRDFLAADLLIRHPAMTTAIKDAEDHSKEILSGEFAMDNWWCPAMIQSRSQDFKTLAFHQAGRTRAIMEWERLRKLDNATNQLARIVLAYAKTHPDDPRIPENLHRLIQATRGGCVNAETSGLSKKMFRLLHDRYKNNPWTRRTKYHY